MTPNLSELTREQLYQRIDMLTRTARLAAAMLKERASEASEVLELTERVAKLEDDLDWSNQGLKLAEKRIAAYQETHNLMMTRRGRPYPPRVKERQ